jgi:hypothetical protein
VRFLSQEFLNVSIKADKENLRELIKKILDGQWRLYLPQFQRGFEWDSEDVKDFLDSIIRNLPVGSIILWKPSGKIEDDPFAVPLINVEGKVPGESFYLLDGQQRLTSLLMLYSGWEIRRGDETKKLDEVISYVPSSNKLVRGTRGGLDLSTLVKSYIDGRLDSVIRDYPSYKEELENVARRIGEYGIPIYTLTTYVEDNKVLGEMAEAFIRVNRAGVRIGLVELMLSFLAGTVSGDFSKEVRKIHKKLEKYDIDLNVLTRFVLSNFKIKQTVFSNIEQFRSSVEKISFESEKLTASEKSIELVMELLSKELGLSTSRIIPSSVSLIPISAYFYGKHINTVDELEESERKNISNWFVLVNMKGYYSSSTNSKLEKDLEIVRRNANSFPYNELLNNLGDKPKIRKVDIEKGNSVNVLKKQGQQYMFLLLILLYKDKAEDLDGCILANKPYKDMHRHHIFPRNILNNSDLVPDEPDEKEIFISGLGNITFVSEETHKQLPDEEPSEYIPKYPPLLKHFIPEEKSLWKLENFERFKQARIEKIYMATKEHFNEITE